MLGGFRQRAVKSQSVDGKTNRGTKLKSPDKLEGHFEGEKTSPSQHVSPQLRN